MATQKAAAGAAPTPQETRRAVGAAVIGNVLEWYDFSAYGFVATILAARFFPTEDPSAALLSTFAAFGLGFVVRPLGGIVIGRLGDVKGRKIALLITIFMMAFGTVAIGLLPGYETIGIAAPILLVICRMVQGFAAGGEWGGSTAFLVEWAPPGKRGYYGSFQQASVAGGLLLGSVVAAICTSVFPHEAMMNWGWRVPFLLGTALIALGFYMRRNIEETPAYREAEAAIEAGQRPVQAESNWLLGARAFGFTILWTVSYYVMLSYMPTFTQRYAGLSSTQALWSSTLGLVVLVLCIPLMGALSDRIGRKPLLLGCCISFVVLTYPLFVWMLATPGAFGTIMLIQVIFGIMIAAFSGPGPAAISEIFPTHSRSTWMSTGYSLAVSIFGGFAPFFATWLIGATGSPISPTFYLIAAAIASTVVIATLRETAHRALD
jgi:MHS family proline/betaine transporter-like MFS transporter